MMVGIQMHAACKVQTIVKKPERARGRAATTRPVASRGTNGGIKGVQAMRHRREIEHLPHPGEEMMTTTLGLRLEQTPMLTESQIIMIT
jgi:hypothetical protein